MLQNMIRDWANLPIELLELILSNLYAKDRLTFGLVCKSWNYIATKYGHPPCLMFYQRKRHCWRFFQHNGFFEKHLSQLDNAEIRCSKYGWLLLSLEGNDLCFFNPLDEQRIDILPKMKVKHTIICFFNKPTSSNWMVIGISNGISSRTDYKDMTMSVLKCGDNNWNVCGFEHRYEVQLSLCNPILHCGTLYCLGMKGIFVTFDLVDRNNIDKHDVVDEHNDNGNHDDEHEDDGPSWEVHHRRLFPSRLRNKLKQQFLIKLEGEEVLFAVFVAHDERKVSVYRTTLVEEGMTRWELVTDLGDKALFVSHTSSLAMTAPSENMANKIYFTMIYEDSRVYYCLKTRKYFTIDGTFSNNNRYEFKELNFATWILPTSPS